MHLGTRILLMMLLITVGTSAALAWVVTLNITRYETRRADDEITRAIAGYVSHLDDRHRQMQQIVRALLEAPAARSQLQAADEAGDPAALEQLKQEIFGRTVQTELTTPEGGPAFHVVANLAGDVLLAVAPGEPALEEAVDFAAVRWPLEPVLEGGDRLVSHYVPTPAGLFLAMGIPLHTQLDQPPSHACFVGFRVDDEWVRRQLLSDRVNVTASSGAPLTAWFQVGGRTVAAGSADPGDARVASFTPATPVTRTAHREVATSRPLGAYDSVRFENAGERYVGQSFVLNADEPGSGRVVLASSLDQALRPLASLQKQIMLCAVAAGLVAVVTCRSLAKRIAKPIQELVEGTQRVTTGHFDQPVKVRRRDELGTLGDAFNQMSAGLKERDVLRDQRTKTERDLALARKIQMDVLPKRVPPCPGYDIAAYSLPAEQTGGDIYDLVAVALDPDAPPGRVSGGGGGGGKGDAAALVLLLADATGHGMGPALSVTQVRSMLRIGVRLRAGLDHVLSQINRQLCQDLGADRFVTAFLGLLDPASHSVNYHSAGQAPLLHFRARDRHLYWLDSSTLPLGIDEDPYDEGVQRILLEPGDLLVLLTDGFYEFENGAGHQFSRTRVAEVILAHHDQTAKVVLAELLEATKAFGGGAPQLDDMTALIIKRLPADHPAALDVSPHGHMLLDATVRAAEQKVIVGQPAPMPVSS